MLFRSEAEESSDEGVQRQRDQEGGSLRSPEEEERAACPVPSARQLSVARASERGFCPRPPDSWIALPGKGAERRGVPPPVATKRRPKAPPGQFYPWASRPGKRPGSSRDPLLPNKPLSGALNPSLEQANFLELISPVFLLLFANSLRILNPSFQA